MGMFDTVQVDCPICGEIKEYQSKSGPCALETYAIYDAPLSVLGDVIEGYAYPRNDICDNCGHHIQIVVQKMVAVL